ncbi:MAG TPA: hypothetical protein VIX37_22350 [Candidatus Sulfotelmatobacter sp.]
MDKWDSLTVQNKPWKHVEKSGFCKQSPCSFRKRILKSLRRYGDLLHHGLSSFDNSDKVFKVVAGLKIRLYGRIRG